MTTHEIPEVAVQAVADAFWQVEDGRLRDFDQARTVAREALQASAWIFKVQALREAAALVDVEGSEVDWEETTEGAGRRHAADEIDALADEYEAQA